MGCEACGKNNKTPVLQCCLCAKWYHFSCVGMDGFADVLKSNQGWKCMLCFEPPKKFWKLLSKRFSGDVIDAKSLDQKLENQTAGLTKIIDSLRDEIRETKRQVSDFNNMLAPQQSYASVVMDNADPSSDGGTGSIGKTIPVQVTVPTKQFIKEIVYLKCNGANETGNMETAKELATDALNKTEVCFLKSNRDKGQITMGFPSLETRQKAEILLKKVDFKSSGFQIKSPIKQLPKLTIRYIPLDIFKDSQYTETNKDNSSDASDPDENEKMFIKNKIIQKNDVVSNLVKDGHTFNVIYMKKFQNFVNVGVKVSPVIRNYIFQKGRVFIGNTSCPVNDRFLLKQCYRCQAFGHFAKDCTEATQACKYCAGEHTSSTCSEKLIKGKYKCVNCSKNETSYVDHASDSEHCPQIIKAINRIKNSTDYCTKNAI